MLLNTRRGYHGGPHGVRTSWPMAWEHPATAEDPWNKDCKDFFYSRPLQQTLLRNSLNEYFAWILMYHVSWRTAKNKKYEPAERYSDCKLTKAHANFVLFWRHEWAPVNWPIFLRTEPHSGSIATSPVRKSFKHFEDQPVVSLSEGSHATPS